MITQEYIPQPFTALSDGALAHMILNGEQHRFELLVQRYQGPLFSYIYHFVADYDTATDITQQVFIRLYTSLPTLKTDKPFKAWLFQVARRNCIDEVRRRQRQAIPLSELETDNDSNGAGILDEMQDSRPLPEEILERKDFQHTVQQAIALLPPKFRQIVVLRYAAELKFTEIADILGMPEATAKTYFLRAKRRLKLLMGSSQEPIFLQ